MASILDEIKAEVEAELSQQPQEKKPVSVLEDVKQEVSAEPQQTLVEEPQGDFFESAERWLEPAPTQKSSGDIFLGLISNKRSNELDDEEKGLFNALSDDEQYKVAQARKDIPLDDAQARRIFEVEKSKMPSVPTSWEDWYNLGGDAFDVVKNVVKLGVKVPLGAAEFGRDAIKASDMTVSDEEFYKNLKKAKSSFYSFMAPAFEIPESVLWATEKAKEGGFGWADAAGEKLGLVSPEDRFENWKGRRLVSQAQAEYFREHPTIYGRLLDSPLAKDALSYIAKTQMESPEELAKRNDVSIEEARSQQDAMARQQVDQLTSEMESELPEENIRVRTAGEFLLPGEVGMGTMGAVSIGFKGTKSIAQGLKYIGKSADEIAEINKAAQALRKSQFAEMLKKRTERAEAVAQGAGKIEKAIEGWKPAAEKVNKILGNITTPVLGGIAGYSVSDESPVTGILSGVIGGVAARGVLKGTKVGLEIPTFVRELAEARKVAPLGKTFETLGKSAEGSALKAKILSRGGKTIDNILSNSVEYARTGIHGTTLALATGALESADPEEMKQMLADGLAITLGGRALQHIKGKFMGGDPVIAQRERISDDSRIHRRYQESDPETQANLDQISDFDNAIAAKQTKLNESESDLANLIAAYRGSGEDANKIKLAQSVVEADKVALDQVKRANVQTRNEFGREFLKTYANLQDITNGVMKSGQNNVGFNVLSTDQIYQKLRNDPANSNVPDADLAQMASQAGFYSNPAQQGLAFDRRKPSIVINADSIRERIKLFGESPTEALVHETSHFMDVVPEFQEALAPVRSMLFQNEIRDAAGNIKATTSGIFSKAKLVELFNDGYLRHLDPQGREAFSKLNKLWDESRGQLDENKVANYMKSEVMADLLGEVSSRHLSNDLDSATLAMWDRARIKAKKNLLDRAINRFYGLGGRGDIVTAANTRAEFPPEAMAAARDAMRQIVSLNGEISPPAQEADMPAISKAQMMKNSALIERFGKDSPLFKTEFKVKVFDKDGNQVGESMPVTTPNPREGTFQSTDVGMKKLSGYGDIPAEAQGLQVPKGGTLVVSRDLVMEPDGVTPVMYDAKDAKKIDADRKKLITEALDTDDYGTPNRFEPVEEGSETYRGTFTPLQIQAIKDMPESLVPRTLKEHMLKINDAIARGDGTRFIVDYAAVMNDKGKYQAFSPKMYDLVPIGMHLSSKGNFLVTTISVGRIFDKMRLWNERMPGRLRFWDNNLERTFDDFSKYLNNWQQGKAGETGLDADPQVALQKKNIFNDLLNLYDNATEYTNLERTKIPRKKGDPRNKDANRTIMSIRVDHIAELIPNENATKLPVNYGFAKINFMPERMEGESTTQENDNRKNIGISFMPERAEDYAYRGEHKAPDQESGSPLNEVTKGIYPPDFYTLSFDKALQYYGSGDDISDRESLSAILSAKGKANAKVKVYRAVPKYVGEVDPAKSKEIEDRIEKYAKLVRQNPWSEDFQKQLDQALSERPQQITAINAGDWVTPSRSYAVDHGESALNGEYRILSKSIPASHLFTEGNSLSEFGYNPPVEKGVQFMPERPAERFPTPERGFYSGLQQTIDQKVQGKFASPDQIKAIVSNPQNVKAEEQKWSGVLGEIDRLAAENQGKVPKDKVMEYLRNEGAVKFEEVTLGESRKKESYDQISQRMFGIPFSETTRDQGLQIENERISAGEKRVADSAKYAQYQLPGGENYREVVMAMPAKPMTFEEYSAEYKASVPNIDDATIKARYPDYLNDPGNDLSKLNYKSSHFPEIPNYVAHMRLNERTDAEGNDGLFVEELQSDRHQAGREKGYKSDSTEFYLKSKNGGQNAGPFATRESADFANDGTFTLETREPMAGVPDAPFRKDWSLQLFKRALRDAVESGKQWIGWTAGETQAERYDLSKQIDRIEYNEDKQGGRLTGEKGREMPIIQTGITPDKLADYIGKETAQKLLAQEKDKNGWRVLENADLKVGGEGMKGFYDQILPKEIGKYVGKMGGKVEKDAIDQSEAQYKVNRDSQPLPYRLEFSDSPEVLARFATANEAWAEAEKRSSTPIWKVNITPEMAGAVKGGQLQFMPERPAEQEPTIGEKPKGSQMIGADTIKTADLETSAKPETDAVIKPFSNALVSSAGLINFLPAYHGTPFEVDKFKLANIGTGEGAQAYGWGLYFAQARQVGEEYKNKVRDFSEIDKINQKMSKLAEIMQEDSSGFRQFKSEKGRKAAKEYDDLLIERRTLNEAEGNLYKVDIDVKDEDLLDWDKPLSEQSEKVQKAFAKYASGDDPILKELFSEGISAENIGVTEKSTGGQIYNTIASGDPKKASEALFAAGIPGIRYLDGISRKSNASLFESDNKWNVTYANAQKGSVETKTFDSKEKAKKFYDSLEGTYNYVIFDENLIKILDKNDKPVQDELPRATGLQFMPARKEKDKKESLKIRMTKEALTDAALNQSSWKDWYKEHQDVLDDFFGDHAELFQEILAVTSQAASVKANVGLALKAFGQLMRGEEFDARLRGEEKGGYLDGVINNLNAIKNKTGVSGRKISNYKAANEGDVSRVVVDRHITRLLFGVDTPSKAQYDLAEKVLTEIANDIGWEPSQVQAALWAHSIVLSGKEPESYGAYLTKLESNPLTKKEIASGLTGNQLTKRIGKLAYAGQGNLKSGGGRGRYSKDGETKTK